MSVANIHFSVSRNGNFTIDVASNQAGRFLAVASGAAQVDAFYDPAIGERNDFSSEVTMRSLENGRKILGVFHADQASFIAPGTENYFTTYYGIEGYNPEGDVKMGTAATNDGNFAAPVSLLVRGKLHEPVTTRSSSTEVGRLPLIGAPRTAYINAMRMNNTVPFTSIKISGSGSKRFGPWLGMPTRWFIPDHATVDLSVSYSNSEDDIGNLPSRYRLESAQPPASSSSELRWKLANYAQVAWTVTDLSAERAASKHLFIAGILLGTAGAFFGIAIDRTLDLF